MKKLAIFTLGLLFFTNAANAKIDPAHAQNFIKELTHEGIEELINSNADKKTKDAKFKKLFEENLDLDFIGKFVLGRYWRTARPEQKKNFIKAYKDYNIRTWSERFDEFKGRRFTFKGTTPSSNSDNQIFVNTEVDMGNSQTPIKVVWRVLEEDNGEYKVVDIIIENVSLAISARTEYTSYIKNTPGGINALIAKLEGK